MSRPRESNKPPSKSDWHSWFLHTAHRRTVEDIAAQRNTTVEKIQKSVDMCNRYTMLNSAEMAVIQVNSLVLDSMSDVKKVIKRGFLAKKIDRNGKKVDDIGMQLRTVDTLKGFADMGQPKTPAFQLNQQFNNNGGAPGSGSLSGGSSGSFESRLRMLRESRGLTNGDDVIDAEVEDDNEPQSVEDELADIGLDITGEDEE